MYEDAMTRVTVNGRVRLSVLELGCIRVPFSACCYSIFIIFLEASSRKFWEGMELLYADNLAMVAETEGLLLEKPRKWKKGLKVKGLRVFIDSIPTSIIKSCSGIFSILITRLATLSFSRGSFPASYKTASVTPLLKKKDLDPDNPASFRPISNLHTISKVLERLFLSRTSPHVESSQNFNRFQSAYRRGFSTETAILRMLNDVYSAADDRCRSMIVLLDLSAAFDTIDKSTLLCRLQHTFGISGSALLWFKSYLEGRTQ